MKIIFGTWSLSGDYGYYNKEKSESILLSYLKNNIHEFNTAPNYGYGKAEQDLSCISQNKNVLINTKIGNDSKKIKGYEIKIKELKPIKTF